MLSLLSPHEVRCTAKVISRWHIVSSSFLWYLMDVRNLLHTSFLIKVRQCLILKKSIR